jgi:hypothetical protein
MEITYLPLIALVFSAFSLGYVLGAGKGAKSNGRFVDTFPRPPGTPRPKPPPKQKGIFPDEGPPSPEAE